MWSNISFTGRHFFTAQQNIEIAICFGHTIIKKFFFKLKQKQKIDCFHVIIYNTHKLANFWNMTILQFLFTVKLLCLSVSVSIWREYIYSEDLSNILSSSLKRLRVYLSRLNIDVIGIYIRSINHIELIAVQNIVTLHITSLLNFQ